jgi:hypothetical protein
MAELDPSEFLHGVPVSQPQDPVTVATVNGIVNWAQNFATATAQSAINTLQQTPGSITINTGGTGLSEPEWPGNELQITPPPTLDGDLVPNFPAAPVEPYLESVSALEVDGAPVLTATSPTLAAIDLPDPLAAVLPELGAVTDVVIPETPTFTLPDVPTLFGLDIPEAPTIELPIFDDTMMDRPQAPDVTFAWSEAAYASTLLTAMNDRLITFVQGASTGLTPEVEQAIWSRARARENANTLRGFDEIRRAVAQRGFAVPPGSMQVALQRAVQDAIEKDSSLSRDVMVKQAELEQENFRFAFTTALGLESKLIDLSNQVVQRAYEAAKYALAVQIDLLNAKVALYNADAQAFVAKANVFKVRLEAALAALDVYKAELEGQKLVGELNLQLVQVYKARLDGVLAAVEIYKTRVAAAQAQAEVNRNVIEGFKAEVQAYGEVVKAKALEYESYATQVKAQATQAEIYATQVAAHKSQAEAYASLVNAKVASKTFEVRMAQEIPLQLFERRVAAYGETVRAEASRLKAFVDIFDAEIKGYSASIDGAAKTLSAQASLAQARATAAAAQAQVSVAQIRAAADQVIANAEITSANLRAQGQVSGMLAAAAMAQFNTNTSMSTSHSTSDAKAVSSSTSGSVSSAVSYNHNYNHAE